MKQKYCIANLSSDLNTFYISGEKKEVLPPAAKAVAKSQRMLEYPVSSGNAHRIVSF